MKYIIDRFEGNYAVLEDEDRKDKIVLINLLPKGVKEGYVIELMDNNYVIDFEETELRQKKFQNRMKKFKRQ